ncbi:MAG: ABC transporter ATP-binding protein [Proteobacteria bacterium]|nr:ABC transporter ATP-binding protein [Pseudomonadota bacterium]
MLESSTVDTVVKIRQLYFSRSGRPIFKGIDIDVPRNKIIGIMGPSGTGKTTLLNLIGGRYRPDSGTISVYNKNVAQLSRQALYKLRRGIGVLFQEGALFTDLNVFENVAFPLREHTNLPEDMIENLVRMQLNAVGLRGAVNLRIDELSGGMARRVAMARATVLGPGLMLYDEPFTGQDPISKGVLVKLIKELNDALGLTSILVSHDVAETTQIADYIYILAGGKVIGQGPPKELLSTKIPEIEQFTHGLPDGPVAFHFPAKEYSEDLNL